MKAVQFTRFGGPEVLDLVDVAEPHAARDQVRIRVQAAGVNASDWEKRKGLMDPDLPQRLGHEAAGIVDEVGDDVIDIALGDKVFGFSAEPGAQAEMVTLQHCAHIPASLSWAEAAALPAATETAARALDQLGAIAGKTIVIHGASGSVGSSAVQLAKARGARVIGTGSRGSHERLHQLGAEPITYGEGLENRVRTLAPHGIDVALDVGGTGDLPILITLTGSVDRVITLSDDAGAEQHGVRFSRGDAGRALYIINEIGELVDSGRLQPPPVRTFALDDITSAHQVGEARRSHAKIVLVINNG